jgi:hypothetical protein
MVYRGNPRPSRRAVASWYSDDPPLYVSPRIQTEPVIHYAATGSMYPAGNSDITGITHGAAPRANAARVENRSYLYANGEPANAPAKANTKRAARFSAERLTISLQTSRAGVRHGSILIRGPTLIISAQTASYSPPTYRVGHLSGAGGSQEIISHYLPAEHGLLPRGAMQSTPKVHVLPTLRLFGCA